MEKIKELINKISESKVINFILRHISWIAGVVIGLYFLGAIEGLAEFIIFVCMMECIAIGLSMSALFAYTKINFTKKFIYGDDDILDESEAIAFQKVIGSVFLGVHILVGVCTMVFYSGAFIK